MNKNEKILMKLLGLASTILSYIFTIMMMMTFGKSTFDKCLYFLAGVIIDGVKWFALLTAIKYYKAKFYKTFITYLVLFSLFLSLSIIASVSFSIYQINDQMYDKTVIENTTYNNLDSQVETLRSDIETLKGDKESEISRLNNELDGLPLDYTTRRKEIEAQKLETSNNYDKKIEDKTTEMNDINKQIETAGEKETEQKTLKNNAIAGLFNTVATVLKVDINNIITGFAIILGILLDVAGVSFTLNSAFTYDNLRDFNKEQNKNKNMWAIREKQKERAFKKEDLEEEEEKEKIIDFKSFRKVVENKNLDEIKFSELNKKYDISSSTFYKWIKEEEAKREEEENENVEYENNIELSI